MKKIKGRMISILLSIVVAAGLLPVSSFASENIKYEADADIERAEYAEDSEHAEDPKTAERPAHVNEPQTGELPDPGELPEADGFAAAPKDPAPEPEQITVLAEGSSEELPPPSADALFEAAPGEEGEDGAVSPEDSEEEEYGRVRAAGAKRGGPADPGRDRKQRRYSDGRVLQPCRQPGSLRRLRGGKTFMEADRQKEYSF